MFPSPIDLTVPDPRDQVRIVSRIALSVASDRSGAVHGANESENYRKPPENAAFGRQFLTFWWKPP
jgi:hypothetical protein